MMGAVLGRGRRRGAGWRVGVAASMLAASTVVAVAVAAGGAAAASANPRDFDTSFGTAGTGVVQYATGTGAKATGVAVVPSGLPSGQAGDLVVSTDGGSGSQFELARFTPSGAIDTTFGPSGTGVVDLFAGEANAVAVVPPGIAGAGNVVVVGEASGTGTCGGQQPVVVVYNPAGATTTTQIPCVTGFFGGVLNAVTVDASGNMAVAGQILSPTATLETLVAHVTAATGTVVYTATAIGTRNSAAQGVGVEASGDIVTAGYSYALVSNIQTRYLTVAAFSPTTGALDTAFNGTGVVTTSAANSIGDAITVLAQGNIVAAGAFSATPTSPNQALLAKFTSSGAEVASFGSAGEVRGTPSLGTNGVPSTSEYHAVAFQPEGGVLIAAGSALSGQSQEMVVSQYDSATGVPNSLFGGGSGAVPVSFSSGPSSLGAVAVQPDGKAVGAGVAPTVNDSPDIGLVRVQVPAPRPYTPITPTRVCDTRPPYGLTGLAAQCTGHTIAPNTSLTVAIGGAFGVPLNATAVVVNVTTVNPVAPGVLTAYPAGSAVPTASNLNVTTKNQVVANLVEVAVSGGAIAVFSSVQTDVVVDVEGYTAPIAAGGAGAGLYVPLPTPTRVCDTRGFNPSNLTGTAAQCNSKTIPAGGAQVVQVAGAFGVPANATAIVGNLTTVNSTGPGVMTAYPNGLPAPTASNLNFTGGQVLPNRVIVPVGTGGSIDVASSVQSDAVFDISGYYTAAGGSGAGYVVEPTPVRICDTRVFVPPYLTGAAAQCNGHPVTSGGTLTVQVTNNFAVPSSAKAAVVNVTAVNPTVGTVLTVYPGGGSPPVASDLNPPPSGVEPNLVIPTLSSSGSFSIFNSSGQVDVVVDLAGYYTAPGAGT